MFGIGFSEMVVIGLVLLIAVGPKRMPGLIKGAAKAYREFRKATRDLRASTGIDEILQDEDLQALRKPLYVPPKAASKKKLPPNVQANSEEGSIGEAQTMIAKGGGRSVSRKRALSYSELIQENPPEGVDLVEIWDEENAPSEEERAQIIAAKEATVDTEQDEHDRIVAAKDAAAAPQSEQALAALRGDADEPALEEEDGAAHG